MSRAPSEYDIATAVVLGATLANAFSRDDVTFIDAATIGLLIRARNGLRRESRKLRAFESIDDCEVVAAAGGPDESIWLGAMSRDRQDDVWGEIETALTRYDTDDGFVGPCELLIAGATR